MKEAKKDPFEERVQELFSISDCLKLRLVDRALRYTLSPSEMLLVAAHFSSNLCLSISKHCRVDLSKVVDVFNYTMKEWLEEENGLKNK